MYELPSSRNGVVAPYFTPGAPGDIFVSALLEGHHRGRIFADNADAPSTYLVALACDFNFLAGEIPDPETGEQLRSFIEASLTPEDGYVLLVPTTRDWENHIPRLFSGALEIIRAGRLTYAFDDQTFAERYERWRVEVPRGYAIHRYDADLARGQGFEAFWGSVDAFLEQGFGFAVLHGTEVISRCHTVFVGQSHAEISIETGEAYRRQGFGTLAACAFLDHCAEVGLTPAWSCWDNNSASQRLAEHLGFKQDRADVAYVVRLR